MNLGIEKDKIGPPRDKALVLWTYHAQAVVRIVVTVVSILMAKGFKLRVGINFFQNPRGNQSLTHSLHIVDKKV